MKKLFMIEFGKARIDNYIGSNASPVFVIAESYDEAIFLAKQQRAVNSLLDEDGSLRKEHSEDNIAYIKMLSDNVIGSF